jgi:hypothetical protein
VSESDQQQLLHRLCGWRPAEPWTAHCQADESAPKHTPRHPKVSQTTTKSAAKKNPNTNVPAHSAFVVSDRDIPVAALN